ncbi:YraN family protein [Terriglobus sp.]|uniref:YraN family protein n=1 Tax=Terriglobus sp. TaxID=1889013 RepID=UPI003AFF913A
MRPWLRLNEAGLDVLAAIRARRDTSRAARRRALGDAGERRAYFHLRRLGYVIVARQWRAPNLDGEIDLIAWHGETLCFVEVKTRASRDQYAPERLVHGDKRHALRRMARAYVRGLYSDGDPLPNMRADVVTVLRLRREWRVQVQTDAFSLRSE